MATTSRRTRKATAPATPAPADIEPTDTTPTDNPAEPTSPATIDDGEPDPNSAELWLRGEADLTGVDLTAAAVRVVCPTCQRPMPRRNTVAVGRTGPAAPGHNGDGQRTLAKNELRNLVRDF